MKCPQIQEALRLGETSGELEDHLQSCQACRQEAARFQGLRELLGQWPNESPPLGLPEKTLRRVQEAPAAEYWVDRWIRLFSAWLTGRHPATVALAGALLMCVVLAPNWSRSRAQGELTGCQTNLRTLSIALEDYSKEHQGLYPDDLSRLNLRQQPLCPSSGAFTYALEVGQEHRAYTLYCAGHHHRRENFPQYSSQRGPLEP